MLTQRPIVEDDANSAHADLAGTPHSAPLARLFLREQLRRRLPPDVLATAELLTTELVTNVVLHARTSIRLGVTWDDHNLLVTVQDHDTARPVERQQLAEDHLVESGRGLTVISGLADDFGWERLPDGAGKVMWFVLSTDRVAGRA